MDERIVMTKIDDNHDTVVWDTAEQKYTPVFALYTTEEQDAFGRAITVNWAITPSGHRTLNEYRQPKTRAEACAELDAQGYEPSNFFTDIK